MPSKRKPYTGNKFTLTSKEAKELRAAIAVVVYQVGQLTGVLQSLHARLVKLEPPPAPPVPDTQLDLPFEPNVPEATKEEPTHE